MAVQIRLGPFFAVADYFIVTDSAVLLLAECNIQQGPVAQWIRHRSTEPEIGGSSPPRVIFFSLFVCQSFEATETNISRDVLSPVSYTHLTLPTIPLV